MQDAPYREPCDGGLTDRRILYSASAIFFQKTVGRQVGVQVNGDADAFARDKDILVPVHGNGQGFI